MLLAMRKNLVISAVVMLLCYGVLEASFLWWFPRVMPASAMAWLEEGLQPLAQSAKRGVMPHHYLALAGDSYAQGMGDWASEAMAHPMARYHSAHLLQDSLGCDVISFGSAGAGSVRGIVTEPMSQLAYLRRYAWHQMEDPAMLLVYFYEGNDLHDNLDYFRYSFPRLFDATQQFDSATYQRYLQQFAVERDATWRQAQRHEVLRYLPFARFLQRVAAGAMGMPMQDASDEDPRFNPPWRFGATTVLNPGMVNKAVMQGQPVSLPDNLQGPAMDLSASELEQAWFALDQSLLFITHALPHTRVVLVYIPSVLSIYALQDGPVSVQTYEGRDSRMTAAQLQAAHAKMQARLRAIAQARQVPVIDTTTALQLSGRTTPVHGPEDWNHFNRRGYEALAGEVLHQLPNVMMSNWQGCAQR